LLIGFVQRVIDFSKLVRSCDDLKKDVKMQGQIQLYDKEESEEVSIFKKAFIET